MKMKHTITMPDGKEATRTSETKTYTHGVCVKAKNPRGDLVGDELGRQRGAGPQEGALGREARLRNAHPPVPAGGGVMALRVAIVPASAIAAKGGKLDARSYTHPFAEPDDKREARLFAGGEPRHLRCFQGPDGGQLVYFNNKYRNTLARYMPRVGHFGLLYTARRRVVGAAFHSAASLGVSLERTSVDGVLSIEWEGTSPGLGRKNQRPYDYQLGRAIEFDELDKPFAEAVVRAYRELWQLTATPGPDIFSRVVAAVPKRLT